MKQTLLSLSIALLFSPMALSHHHTQVSVANANTYESGIDIADYWQSEKLDGIRAIWTGDKLVTRGGHQIAAPLWFTDSLPNYSVEGELWAGRGNFHVVQRTVLDSVPNDAAWKEIDYMLFDLPMSAGDYQKRYYNLIHLVQTIDTKHIKYVEHFPIKSKAELFKQLDNIDYFSGEGLMLRKITSRYQAGRSSDLLKLKKYQDEEATVIGYKLGNGKYKGLMGSILVRLESGIEFHIGSGFTDQQRREPPEIGSRITFRYNGLTQNGIPKFARYMRERPIM